MSKPRKRFHLKRKKKSWNVFQVSQSNKFDSTLIFWFVCSLLIQLTAISAMMPSSECSELRFTAHTPRNLMVRYPLWRWLRMARWWWWWYAVVSSWGEKIVVIVLMVVRCSRCIIAETNTSSTQTVAIASLSTSVQLVVVSSLNDFVILLFNLFIFLFKDSVVWLWIHFFRWTNALLWSNGAVIAVALSDDVFFAGTKLKKVLLIVLWLCLVENCRQVFFFLRTVYEENWSKNLTQISCKVGLKLISNTSDANEQSME